MTTGVHRVRKQSWRVRVRSAEDAFAARLRLRAGMSDLRQALGCAFDRIAPGEGIVRISRLELRLCVSSLDALPDALKDAIERELRFDPPPPARAAAPERLKILLDYLDTGALAWHAGHTETAALLSELKLIVEKNLQTIASRGPRAHASFEEAVQFYFRLLAFLPGYQWPELAVGPFTPTPEPLDAITAVSFITRVLQRKQEVERQASGEALRVLRRSPRTVVTALVGLRASFRHRAQHLAAVVLAGARLPDWTPSPAPQDKSGSEPDFQVHASPAVDARSGAPALERTPRKPSAAVPGSRPTPSSTEATSLALMVGSAGLVLLHSFLPQLFKTCGFLAEELERPEAAAALLHWLATGREEVHEFELGFAKVLLGLRPEAPLAVGEGLLGDREREEGLALLDSAIAHWTALGKISAEGLRVSFLQRRGALREDDAGWRLQLEPEAFDVLLGRLPWGFSTVKLPWMTRPLFTDWPTP